MKLLNDVFERRCVRIKGMELGVIESGNRHDTTLLLIHGIGMSHAYFAPFMNEMVHHVNVVAFDLPGYGNTEDPHHVLTIDEMANLINEYVRGQKFTRCIIAGQSMGAQTATQAVVNDESLYDKLILLAPTINKKERRLRVQAWRLLQDTFREPPLVNWIVFRDYWRMGMRRYFITARSMMQDALERDIEKPNIPILVVNGTRDPICPDEWAEELARRAKRGQLSNIQDAPHLFQFSKPRALRKICLGFLVK